MTRQTRGDPPGKRHRRDVRDVQTDERPRLGRPESAVSGERDGDDRRRQKENRVARERRASQLDPPFFEHRLHVSFPERAERPRSRSAGESRARAPARRRTETAIGESTSSLRSGSPRSGARNSSGPVRTRGRRRPLRRRRPPLAPFSPVSWVSRVSRVSRVSWVSSWVSSCVSSSSEVSTGAYSVRGAIPRASSSLSVARARPRSLSRRLPRVRRPRAAAPARPCRAASRARRRGTPAPPGSPRRATRRRRRREAPRRARSSAKPPTRARCARTARRRAAPSRRAGRRAARALAASRPRRRPGGGTRARALQRGQEEPSARAVGSTATHACDRAIDSEGEAEAHAAAERAQYCTRK